MSSLIHLKRVLWVAVLWLAATISAGFAQTTSTDYEYAVETQNLGTFGDWRAYRDIYSDNTWECVAEAYTSNRPIEDYSSLYAYASFLAFARTPNLDGSEDATFLVEDIIFPMYISEGLVAYMHDEDDFLSMYALAQTRSPKVEIVIKERHQAVSYIFPTRGFRDAYRIIGQACDFDTSLILDAH